VRRRLFAIISLQKYIENHHTISHCTLNNFTPWYNGVKSNKKKLHTLRWCRSLKQSRWLTKTNLNLLMKQYFIKRAMLVVPLASCGVSLADSKYWILFKSQRSTRKNLKEEHSCLLNFVSRCLYGLVCNAVGVSNIKHQTWTSEQSTGWNVTRRDGDISEVLSRSLAWRDWTNQRDMSLRTA